MKQTTVLGSKLRSYTQESTWTIIDSSVMKLSASQLKDVRYISVYEFTDEETGKSHMRAKLCMKQGWTSFHLDLKVKAEEGDLLDPKTLRVYKMTNGSATITRCFAKVLTKVEEEEEEEVVVKPTKRAKKVAKKGDNIPF